MTQGMYNNLLARAGQSASGFISGGRSYVSGYYTSEEQKLPVLGLVVTGLVTIIATSDFVTQEEHIKKYPWAPGALMMLVGYYMHRKGGAKNLPQVRQQGQMLMAAGLFALVVHYRRKAAEDEAAAKAKAGEQAVPKQTAGPDTWLELPSGEFVRTESADIDPRHYDAAIRHAAAFYPGR